MPALQDTRTPAPFSPGVPREFWLAALIGGLSLAAWLSLWLWSASPFRRYVEHGGWADAGMLAELCRALPAGDVVVPAVLHAAVWVLMIAAMMLPTTYPLLDLFRRVVRGRPDAARLTVLAMAGFFVAWFAFGLAAHLADALIAREAQQSAWFIRNGWTIGVAVIGGAGLFQFSSLKYRCLEACRSPFAFVSSRWHGVAPSREAFRLGLDHGVFCVGCCWALMLCMFAVGAGSFGWMLLLAALMAAEKNLPGGTRLRVPVGLGFVAAAGAIVVARL